MTTGVASAGATISRRGAARIRRGHPWVYASDVTLAGKPEPGALVPVLTPGGETLGFGLFSPRSEIRLRMVGFGETLSPQWLSERIEAAVALRRDIAAGAVAYRVVHGEGDLLPSLIVDRYGDYLVIQTLSVGMESRKAEIVARLVELFAPAGILERNDPKVRRLEGLPSQVGVLHGEVPPRIVVEEGDVRFEVDLWKGQKTGLFLDQRENHLAARAYARGRVLDGFTYNGGFALQVAGSAGTVLAVDLSADALERVRANAALNGIANVETRDANVFDLLHDFDKTAERFDTVILDPPAFAKSRQAIPNAWRGYKEINLRALKVLRPGGHLITCSCSYHIHENELEQILAEAAADAGVRVSIVEKRRQARDHPVLLNAPETYYLKCFVLRRLD